MGAPEDFRAPAATAEAPGPVDPGMEGSLPAEIPFLRAFLLRLVAGCPALEVDDLQQQTMDRALKFSHRYDASRPLRLWLHAIAFRVFLDAREDSRRGPRPLAGDEEVPAPTAAGAGSTPGGIAADEAEALLAMLPEVPREVMRRFYLQEQDIATIATEMDLTTGTVKSHLHRARRRLAREHRAEAWT